MHVRDVMKPVIVTIRATHSCYEAAVRMRRAGIHHLTVVDDAGRLEGVVTDRDLRAFLFLTLADTPRDGVVNVDIITETDLIQLLFRRRLFCSAEVESVLLPVA